MGHMTRCCLCIRWHNDICINNISQEDTLARDHKGPATSTCLIKNMSLCKLTQFQNLRIGNKKKSTRPVAFHPGKISFFFGIYNILSNLESALIVHEGIPFPHSEGVYQCNKLVEQEELGHADHQDGTLQRLNR